MRDIDRRQATRCRTPDDDSDVINRGRDLNGDTGAGGYGTNLCRNDEQCEISGFQHDAGGVVKVTGQVDHC